MLEVGILLQTYGYYGGAIGNALARWEQVGVFSYMLPFLLLFALIFGILTKTGLFANKSINAIIALSVGLMALQFDFVPRFFAEIFPRVGVGLAVILAVMIFLGIFAPKQAWVNYTFFGIGAIVLIVILANTAGNIGWYQGYWWYDHWFDIAIVAFVLTAVGIIVGAAKTPKDDFDKTASPILRNLFGLDNKSNT